MLASVKYAAAHAVRKAALLTVGLLLLGVGLAFLTAAMWIVLSAAFGTLVAAAVLGAAYCGLGLIVIVLGSQPRVRHPVAAPTVGHSPLMQAFLAGLQAGSRPDRRRV
jgi:hypothetical protein